MEEKKNLVSEETYQKGKSVLKKLRIILFCIGTPLLVAGIVLLCIDAFRFTFMGACFLSFGFVIDMWGVMTLMVSHRREVIAYNASTVLPVADEVVDKGAPIIEKASEAVGRGLQNVVGGVKEGVAGGKTGVVCKNCGTENSKRNKYCKNCGEKLNKTRSCSVCGMILGDDENFCPNCGEKIEK